MNESSGIPVIPRHQIWNLVNTQWKQEFTLACGPKCGAERPMFN